MLIRLWRTGTCNTQNEYDAKGPQVLGKEYVYLMCNVFELTITLPLVPPVELPSRKLPSKEQEPLNAHLLSFEVSIMLSDFNPLPNKQL